MNEKETLAPAPLLSMERKLAAILSADVKGYSRLMGEDDEATVRTLTARRALMTTLIQQHRGRVVDSPGDNLLAEFASVVDAVRCAVELQKELKTQNAELPLSRQMAFRMGINLGDVLTEGGRLYGDGVNIAARLEGLAEAGGICISGIAYDQVKNKLPFRYEYLGEREVKNIAEPVRVWQIRVEESSSHQVASQEAESQKAKDKNQKPVLSGDRRAGIARLKWIVAGLVLIAATIVAVRYFSLPTASTQPLAPSTQAVPAALPLPDKPSIVVLPFDNMSKDPEQEYFSSGITEVLTSDLSRIASLFVIARNTAFTYKGKATNVQDIGKELGVRYVLEGSVQKASDQVRIVAQLIDTTTGGHLWSQRYDRPFKDIFALQDEIVQKIVTTLKLQLTLQAQGWIVRKHTDNLEAYDYFLRGMESYWRLTKESNAQARQMYEKALALDPQYAEAYAWLGWIHYREWAFRWTVDPQTLDRALALAHQAVALDDSLPIGHSLLSNAYAFKQQYDQAIAEGERAIALDPNSADSYVWQANALNLAGRPEEALRMVEQARRLNPHYPPFYSLQLGIAYRRTGQYTEAIVMLKETISRNPNFLAAHLHLALCYWFQWFSQQSPATQTLESAVAASQRALVLNDSYHFAHTALGYFYLYQRQYDQALAEIERGVALTPTEAWGYAALAEMLSRVGRSEEALEAAAQALRLKTETGDEHLYSIGAAYAMAGRYEEAWTPLQRCISRYPTNLPAHLMLAAVYSELGKVAEAQAEAAEVLRLNPKFSLEVHKERVPIKDPATLERHIAALRKAGLK
jgi:adenylate cyclase